MTEQEDRACYLNDLLEQLHLPCTIYLHTFCFIEEGRKERRKGGREEGKKEGRKQLS